MASSCGYAGGQESPTVAALYNAILYGKGGKWRGLGKTLLLNVACGLAFRILHTKLVELHGDVHPYLAALMVVTLAWAGEA